MSILRISTSFALLEITIARVTFTRGKSFTETDFASVSFARELAAPISRAFASSIVNVARACSEVTERDIREQSIKFLQERTQETPIRFVPSRGPFLRGTRSAATRCRARRRHRAVNLPTASGLASRDFTSPDQQLRVIETFNATSSRRACNLPDS